MRQIKILLSAGLVFSIQAFTPVQAETISPKDDLNVGLDEIIASLKGDGVSIDSPVLVKASNSQLGIFSGYSFLFGTGFDEGVIMSTGVASDVVGPNSSDKTETRFSQATITDPLFGNVYDLAKLSFNVVPTEASLIVEFVFGSEEYNEYAGTAAFTDSVRINVGGSSCALTATGDNVGINTINDRATYPPVFGNTGISSNPFLYINNDPGQDTGEAANTPAHNTAMDGFTRTVTCRASVAPNVSVPVIIGIADGGDPGYDSWVFLKAHSLRSEPSADYGDAPDTYATLESSMGAAHTIVEGVYLGSMPTGDTDGFVDGVDDSGGTAADDAADDGVLSFPILNADVVSSYNLPLNATSINGNDSRVIGWIDFNANGSFEAGEASDPLLIAANAYQDNVTLIWPSTTGAVTGTTYARIRISNSSENMTASDSAGSFNTGEVEDYKFSITGSTDTTAPVVTIDVLAAAFTGNQTAYPVTGSCTAGDGVVSVSVNGATPASQDVVCNGGGRWLASFDVSTIADGSDAIVANASQLDGKTPTPNSDDAPQVTANKDVVPPLVSISALPAAVASNQTAYPVSGSCTAADGAVRVSVTGAVSQDAPCGSTGGWSASFNVSAIANGTAVIIVNASQQDTALNVGTAAQMTADKNVVVPASGGGGGGSSSPALLLLMLLPLLQRLRKQFKNR